MIDFSRAFRTIRKLQNEDDLLKCDRTLLEKLRRLDRKDVARAVDDHLTKWEIDALMARRKLIVSHFDRRIKKEGESRVLY